jgi:hypothetical protein
MQNILEIAGGLGLAGLVIAGAMVYVMKADEWIEAVARFIEDRVAMLAAGWDVARDAVVLDVQQMLATLDAEFGARHDEAAVLAAIREEWLRWRLHTYEKETQSNARQRRSIHERLAHGDERRHGAAIAQQCG